MSYRCSEKKIQGFFSQILINFVDNFCYEMAFSRTKLNILSFQKSELNYFISVPEVRQLQSTCTQTSNHDLSADKPNTDLDYSKSGNSGETGGSFVEQAGQKRCFSTTKTNFQEGKDEDNKKGCEKLTHLALFTMSKSVSNIQDERINETEATVSSLDFFSADCRSHSTTTIDSLHIPCKHLSKNPTDHLPSKRSNNELSNAQAHNTVEVPVEFSGRQSDANKFESTDNMSAEPHPRSTSTFKIAYDQTLTER